MSPLIIKRETKPRLTYRWMRAGFVLLFAAAGIAFLWTPTRWVMSAFQEAQKFNGVRLPAPSTNPLQLTGADSPVAAKKTVTFRLLAPAAREVGLGGTFNNFETDKNPMARQPNGLWEGTADLPPGRYIYKFKVDGEWQLDPTNAENTEEGRGGSVLVIQSFGSYPDGRGHLTQDRAPDERAPEGGIDQSQNAGRGEEQKGNGAP